MDDTKLRRRRTVWIVLTRAILVLHWFAERARQLFSRLCEIGIVGTFAVRTPMALVGTGRRVEDDDSVIDVAVSDIQLIRRAIDFNASGSAEILRVVAALVLALVPNLQQKLPRSRELQQLRILLAAAANPDRVAIDVDAVFEIRPLISVTWSTP